MAVLVDNPRKDGWSHLVASTIDELHAFAKNCGIKKHYFQNKKGKNQPHYDVYGVEQFANVLDKGARLVERKVLHQFLDKHYGGMHIHPQLVRDITKLDKKVGGYISVLSKKGFCAVPALNKKFFQALDALQEFDEIRYSLNEAKTIVYLSTYKK